MGSNTILLFFRYLLALLRERKRESCDINLFNLWLLTE